MTELTSYGKAKAIDNVTGQAIELDVVGYIQGYFKQGRTVTISKLSDDTHAILVENPESSGRAMNQMRLTLESLVGVYSMLTLYCNGLGIPNEELIKIATGDDKINYSASDNIKPINP